LITSFRHVGIVVADLSAALIFWCDTLNFKLVKKMEESGSHIDAMLGLSNVKLTTAKLSTPDGNIIELLHFYSHPDRQTWQGTPFSTGLTHIAFTVENIEKTYSKLVDVGVNFPDIPQVSPDGKVKAIYGRTPDGTLIELVQEL